MVRDILMDRGNTRIARRCGTAIVITNDDRAEPDRTDPNEYAHGVADLVAADGR